MLSLEQKNKLINLGLILIGFVLIFEILFYHQSIINWLINLVESSGIWSWIVICSLQFLQVIFIPIPAYFITLTSMKMYPDNLFLLFILTLFVVMCGVVIAYFIGHKFGKKAVIWAAGSEEEYDKWLNVLKSKRTNMFYLFSVIFPIFPDDILCILVGSIKMNFWWFLFCNLIGRTVGLVTFMFVFTSIGNSIITIIVFGILLLLLFIFKIILKYKRGNKMNLIIIGENTESIAMDIWKGNTNFTVLNKSPYLFNKQFLKFIKNKPVIISTTAEQFEQKPINDVVEFFIKNKFIPIFISNNKKSIERKMHTAIEELIPSALLYTRNKENKDYDILIKTTQEYLIGKGIIENGNKTVRTSRKRKRTSAK